METKQEYESKSKQAHESKAKTIWQTLDKSEKHGVRFGLFPHGKLKEAIGEGYSNHELCVALMEHASRDGGVRG